MQSINNFRCLTINGNILYYKNTNNFMQRIPKKEIGQLFENGHFKNVQNEKVRDKVLRKNELSR